MLMDFLEVQAAPPSFQQVHIQNVMKNIVKEDMLLISDDVMLMDFSELTEDWTAI